MNVTLTNKPNDNQNPFKPTATRNPKSHHHKIKTSTSHQRFPVPQKDNQNHSPILMEPSPRTIPLFGHATILSPLICLMIVVLLFAEAVPHAESKFFGPIFPVVNVTITNELEHVALYVCDFPGSPKTLNMIHPGEVISHTFREVYAPRHWCYVYINSEMQGFFWSHKLVDQCTDDCILVITSNGVRRFYRDPFTPNTWEWKFMTLYSEEKHHRKEE